jgi:hypothetical protein
LQPAVREVGTGLGAEAKLIHVALAPVSAVVWGYDKIKEFVEIKVAAKLKDVPADEITTPKANVAGPALEALRYTGAEEELAELYAGLLATAMDKRVATTAHPGFVEVIRQMTSDEAKLMRRVSNGGPAPVISLRRESVDGKGWTPLFSNLSFLGDEAGCAFPRQASVYLDNLCRLGLVEMPDRHYTTDELYKELEAEDSIQKARQRLSIPDECKISVHRGGVWITEFGKQFMKVCLR